MRQVVRIGNGCGFWGDNVDAPVLLAEKGALDYLTLEYLAELTMSILARQLARDPGAGYATDFVDVVSRLTTSLASSKLRIITNAGGMNPLACAQAVRKVLDSQGLGALPVGVVTGDDLLPDLDDRIAQGHLLEHLDTGESVETIRSRVVSANAYLGSLPLVEALRQGARIVLTGRVADASLTVAPAMYAFGWKHDDWDRLASASVAGHLIECGAQATGGLWCNWQETDLTDVGYPIAEIGSDGAFTISKPPSTGGSVNVETLAEQLLYEVGDPAAYYTPDVVADFTSVHLQQVGPDVVAVTAARGKPAPEQLKVSIAYREGWTAAGTLVIAGPGAVVKARRCGEMILGRLARAGVRPEHHLIECLGAGDSLPGVLPATDASEVVLRVAVRDSRKGVVDRFSRELAPLVTSGPPGVTGYTTGRPQVREVLAYWPARIDRRAVQPQVTVI